MDKNRPSTNCLLLPSLQYLSTAAGFNFIRERREEKIALSCQRENIRGTSAMTCALVGLDCSSTYVYVSSFFYERNEKGVPKRIEKFFK